jgi:hypothetical protein
MLGTASFADFVELLGEVVWPALAAILLVTFVVWLRRSPGARRFFAGLAERITSIKGPGGFELNLKPESAEKAKSDLESQFAEYRVEIRKRFDALNYQHNVVRIRDRVVEDLLTPALRDDEAHLRCIIYTPDIVFADALYALTDYYPSGGGAGGVYSIRFGIIGRQWRLRESRYEPTVPTDAHDLMGFWGMTKAQANAKSRDQSFLVVMLIHESVEQGLLLVSSESPCPFGKDPSICEHVTAHELTKALAKQIALVNGEMRDRGPALKLFDV